MNKSVEESPLKKLKIAIIGAGRVGTTVAYILSKKKLPDLELVLVASRSSSSIDRAREILGQHSKGIIFTLNISRALAKANCVVITTPDDAIEEVCMELFGKVRHDLGATGAIKPVDLIANKPFAVLHMSGSKSLGVLRCAEEKGAVVASIHPLKSFASIEEAIKTVAGTVFGVTFKDANGEAVAEQIVRGLDGSIIKVDDQKKPLYHAAACIASNYLVSLLNYAVFIHERIGINPKDSLKGLMSLAQGTVENIKKLGTRKSLTGPIARGDVGTIKEHLENFSEYFQDDEVLPYRVMGRETAKIAYLNGWIDEEVYRSLLKLLE
ncbi:MAG: DUF2520 domain-containing protein [Actinobacteria bacterium]|nr:DUF2520 domain-containing protein [Actinomycetota bacterium]